MNWQPIETAPKDGTVLLHGWNQGRPEHGSHIVIGSYFSPAGRWIDREHDEPNRDLGAHLCYITHWMPLPAPPEAQP